MVEFTNDELSLIYVVMDGYSVSIANKVSSTSKKKAEYPDLLHCNELSTSINQKLKDYFEAIGAKFEVQE